MIKLIKKHFSSDLVKILSLILLISILLNFYFLYRFAIMPANSKSESDEKVVSAITSTPEPSPTQTPMPTIASTVTTNIPVAYDLYIQSATIIKKDGKQWLELRGYGFGSNYNQIMFDNNVHNYGYNLWNWTNDFIELVISDATPRNKPVEATVIRQDARRSNSVSFTVTE